MTERRGLWSPLSSPWVYEAFHHLIGARRWLKRFARDTVRANVGDRVLDIGCGPGPLLRYVPQATYIGFDRNEAYIRQARSSNRGNGTFICDDVDNFFRHGQQPVDVAVAIGIVHHLDDGTALGLYHSVLQVLKPGGRLITVDPCFHTDQSALQRFVVSIDRGMHVRPYQRYIELCGSVFPGASARFERGHLPFPYSVCILQAAKAPSTEVGA